MKLYTQTNSFKKVKIVRHVERKHLISRSRYIIKYTFYKLKFCIVKDNKI